MNDLKHIKTIDSTSGVEVAHTPALNPNFGHTVQPYQQSPRSFQFGVRLTF